MEKLHELRLKINEIDEEMAKLFTQRMEVAAMIAQEKKKQQLPIFHPVREQELIAKNVSLVSHDLKDYYLEYLQVMLKISKEYQNKLINNES